jgi:hypothetical protein
MTIDLNSTFYILSDTLPRASAFEGVAGPKDIAPNMYKVVFRDVLVEFIRQSNHIEGIHRHVEPRELFVYEKLLTLPRQRVDLQLLQSFVSLIANGAPMRLRSDQNVTVGRHTPPKGGRMIGFQLQKMLELVQSESTTLPIYWHNLFLWLHPFLDGNGRAARAMWLRLQLTEDADFIIRRLASMPLLQILYYDQLELFDLDAEEEMKSLMRHVELFDLDAEEEMKSLMRHEI